MIPVIYIYINIAYDTKKIQEDVIGELRKGVLEKNGEDQMVVESN